MPRRRGATTLLVAVAAVVLLAVACDPETGADRELTDPVIPLGTIVPLTGGADFPDPARQLLQRADRDLRAGDFDAVAEAAQRASVEADPATRCVADAIQGVADVNRGNIRPGLNALQDGECAINAVPDDVRDVLATLIFNAQAAGYARLGDEDAAERALEKALLGAPEDKKPLIIAQFCQAVGQAQAIERCAPPVTTTPPSPSTTSPPPTTSTTPTSTQPTTSSPPTPTSTQPTTSTPPEATTTSDSGPTTSAG